MDIPLDVITTDALSSMLLVQLPFPCMPVIANRGNEESYCSSHDLLARAFAVRYVIGNGATNPNEVEQKTKIVCEMQKAISSRWQNFLNGKTTEKETIQACYEIYQHHFREYMQHYPIFCKDMRFKPMQDLDKTSVVYKQAVAHLNSRMTMSAETDSDEVATYNLTFTDDSYENVIKAYIEELHSYSDI